MKQPPELTARNRLDGWLRRNQASWSPEALARLRARFERRQRAYCTRQWRREALEIQTRSLAQSTEEPLSLACDGIERQQIRELLRQEWPEYIPTAGWRIAPVRFWKRSSREDQHITPLEAE